LLTGASLLAAFCCGDFFDMLVGCMEQGMDKILQSTGGDVQVTNDGATILKSIHIDNAAAKVCAFRWSLMDGPGRRL